MRACSADQLDALLVFLEDHSSEQNMWNFKVHNGCLRKLEKRARY